MEPGHIARRDLEIDAADFIYAYGIFGSPNNDFDPGAGVATLDFKQGIYLAKLQSDGDLERVQAI